jgi:Serpin (serine protease inhibitor)
MNRVLMVTMTVLALVAADEINFPSNSFRGAPRPSGVVNSVRRGPIPQNPVRPQAGSGSGVQGSFLAAEPMLGFALKLGDCRTSSAFDCNSNTVFSPLGIATTLTLLMSGTNGNCSKQLRKAMRYRENAGEDGINSAYRFILNRMKELDKEYQSAIILNVANGIFTQNALRPDFESKVVN